MGHSADMTRYRVFRNGILENQQKQEVRAVAQSSRTFSDGRRAIHAFREHVAAHIVELIEASPDNELLVRQALCLNASVDLQRDVKAVTVQILYLFLPTRLAIHRARMVLAQSRCLEGRKLLFELFVTQSLPGRRIYYEEALDFALTRLEATKSWEDFEGLTRMDLHLMRSALKLGLANPADIRRVLPSHKYRSMSKLLWVLVSEGVICSVQELSWMERVRSWSWMERTRSWSGMGDVEEWLDRLRTAVRCLMAHAVQRELVAGLLQHPLMGLQPDRLSDNLIHLKSAGVSDLSGVLRSAGELLWRSPTASWRFVTDVLGARSAEEIARFKQFLDCQDAMSAELVSEIRALGGGLDELVLCQELIKGLRPGKENIERALGRLRTLAAPPHELSIEQLSQCLRYLRDDAAQHDFVQVLIAHGLSDGPSLLAFQRCFGKIPSATLTRILSILGNCGRGQPPAEIVAWVEKTAQSTDFEAYEYLVGTCDIHDFAALRQALKLVALGVPFLQYLADVRGLKRLKEMRRWYYNACGIEGYRSWKSHDAADRLLIEDAFARNQFSMLGANQQVVQNIVRERVERDIGPLPLRAEEVERSAYRRDSEALSAQIRQNLLPMLQSVLDATAGLLLITVFSGEKQEEAELSQNLARLTPLLADLLAGKGPVSAVLSPIEADAIALVYRVPVAKVQAKWREVRGREHDTLRLHLRPSYPMTWQQVRWQLSKPLNRSGFAPMLTAARFAEGLADSTRRDMSTACMKLGPKQLRPGVNSTDLDTLARHLGSLLAIAKRHEVVDAWMRRGFEEISATDEETVDAHLRISELCALFDVVLPDALDQHTDAFVKGLSEEEASHWAERLGPCTAQGSGHERLREVLQLVREKVVPPYLTWARQQRNRYKNDGQGTSGQALTASVSKHPAAFFAKSGTQLCTAENVEMWCEERQFHLVVFDHVGRRMAGMALLYVQNIPELDQQHHSLVIRAINPTDEMLSRSTVASIVEGYIDVAIQIAQDNGLACVAFPPPSGMHLMSNRAGIEAYVKERYVERSVLRSHLGQDSDGITLREKPNSVAARFYAYENGQQLVEKIHVVWRLVKT